MLVKPRTQVDVRREAPPLEALELSTRTRNSLRNLGIQTVEQLTQLTERDLLRGRNFARKSLDEVKDVLRDIGLKLSDLTAQDLEKPAVSETGKIERFMVCAAKRGYIMTDGGNPRVLESPHLIRVFETKDSLLVWLNDNLAEEVTPPPPPAQVS